MLLLNHAFKVLGVVKLSQGGMTSTTLDPKIIFSAILKAGAARFVLSHNHPSGNLTPSKVDRDFTSNLQDGAKILDIEFLDHLVVSRNGYTSFSDELLFLPY